MYFSDAFTGQFKTFSRTQIYWEYPPKLLSETLQNSAWAEFPKASNEIESKYTLYAYMYIATHQRWNHTNIKAA